MPSSHMRTWTSPVISICRAHLSLIAAGFVVLGLVACGSSPKPVPNATGAVEGSAPGPAYGKTAPGTFTWSASMQAARGQLETSLRGTGVAVNRSSDEVTAASPSTEERSSAGAAIAVLIVNGRMTAS